MTGPRARRRAALLTVAAAALVGCGSGEATTASGTQTPAPSPGNSANGSRPADAVALRSGLEMLLGEHVRLTAALVRDRIDGATERATATAAAVRSNTDELAGAVSALLGDDAGARFDQLWSAHVDRLQDYAAALAEDDSSAEDQARERLRTTEGDLGRLLSDASGGRMTPQDAEASVRMHVDMLMAQGDAVAAGDHAGAYRTGRESFADMLATAGALARALAPAAGLPAGDLDAPRRTLQSGLSRLLAEHMGLMSETMRAAYDGSAELGAAGDALNGNSSDLAGAVGALYGPEAAASFLQLWAGHIEGLVAYARAQREDAETPPQQAQQVLGDYAGRLASFLATATSQRLPAVQLTASLTEHDGALTRSLDAYVADDFARSQTVATEGYRHMFGLSQALADAIGDEVAARLPRGGVQTGAGGLVAPRR